MSLPIQYIDIPVSGGIYMYCIWHVWAQDHVGVWKKVVEEIPDSNLSRRLGSMMGRVRSEVNNSIRHIEHTHKYYKSSGSLTYPIDSTFWGGVYKLVNGNWTLIRWVDNFGNSGGTE